MHRTSVVGDWIGTKEARSDYWLGTAELRQLAVRSVGGGVGCGRPEYFYNPDDLERMAILMHGQEGYFAKRAKRGKRAAAYAARLEDFKTSAPSLLSHLPSSMLPWSGGEQ